MLHAHLGGMPPSETDVSLQHALPTHLAKIWEQPDEGIWEVRGGPQHFTYSKVMAWVAFDRAVKAAENFRSATADVRALARAARQDPCRTFARKPTTPNWEASPRPTVPSNSTRRCC